MYETSIVGKTKQGIPIFRIDYDDGNWWELHGERTWGTGKAIKASIAGRDSSLSEIEAFEMKQATNAAALISSTVAWSWDLVPTVEILETHPEVPVLIASRELANRHLSLLLGVEDLKKKFSIWKWLWSKVRRSRTTGSMSSRTMGR